jgi:hypothetical protein
MRQHFFKIRARKMEWEEKALEDASSAFDGSIFWDERFFHLCYRVCSAKKRYTP